MPTRLEYDHSLESPDRWLRVSDPELLGGYVQRVPRKTSVGTTTVPWAVEGGSAVVYRFRCQSGRTCALRCFTQPFDAGLGARYEALDPYLDTVASDITVRAKFHDPGITVALSNGRYETLPLVEMDWVEGCTLLEKAGQLCQVGDRAGLDALISEWIALFQALQDRRIAHGDLSATNVMVRPDGRLTLVDYDSLYIPPFAGRALSVAGSENFQHPSFERPFGERMDLFAALVLYTALVSLQAAPTLWKEMKLDQSQRLASDSLLFTKADLQDPSQSPLFRALGRLGDSRVSEAARALESACRNPSLITLPEPLLARDHAQKLALCRLEAALRQGDDEAVVRAWVPALHDYSPAQKHLASVQLATERAAALRRFRAALTSDDDQLILASYDSALDGYPALSLAETARLELARKRVAAQESLGAAKEADDGPMDGSGDPGLQDSSRTSSEEWEQLEHTLERSADARPPNPPSGNGQPEEETAYGQILESLSKAVGPERRRLDLAQSRLELKARIIEMIKRGDVEAALREESEAGAAIYDEELAAAKKAYADAHPPSGLVAGIEGGFLWARWQWPSSAALRVMAVAWRADRYPDSPDEVGTESDLVERPTYDRRGGFRCRLRGEHRRPPAWPLSASDEAVGPLFVRVFTAIRSPGGEDLKHDWVYSAPGDAPAQCIARRKCHVQWQLLRTRIGGRYQLRLRTADGSPLPDLHVVRRSGGLPLASTDGVLVAAVGSADLGARPSTSIDLDVEGWPDGSVLRVFPAKPEDASWVVVEGKRSPGNRITVS